jgi:hypothetical protein
MKRLLLLQLIIAHCSLLIAPQGLLAQTSLSYLVFDTGTERFCADDQMLVSPLVPDSFVVRDDARVIMHSEEGITLKPGFKASGWNTGPAGCFRAGIAPRCYVFTWNGSVSTDWNSPLNWTPYGVPGEEDEAIIAEAPRDPIYAETEGVRKLTMDGGRLTLHLPLEVNDSLKFVKGLVHTADTAMLVLMDNAVSVWASDSSYVEGPMMKIGNEAFTFPVGRNGQYRAIGMSAPANATDAFVAEYFDVNSHWTYDHAERQGTIADIARNEYWDLLRAVGTSNVEVTLSWDSISPCAFDDPADLLVTVWDGTEWTDIGNGGTTGDTISGTIDSDGPSAVYGAYAIGTTDTIYCDCLPTMADAGGDRDIPFGDDVTLGPSVTYPNLTYAWSPATYLDDDEMANPLCEPLAPTKYYLTVQDGICTVTDSATIRPMQEICGVFPPHTALPPDTNFLTGLIDPIVFDRFGNTYNIADITHGSCTPGWDHRWCTRCSRQVSSASASATDGTLPITPNPFNTQGEKYHRTSVHRHQRPHRPSVVRHDPSSWSTYRSPPQWRNGMTPSVPHPQFYIPAWELCTTLSDRRVRASFTGRCGRPSTLG